MLATLDPQTPPGARNVALVHCLTHLGLRAGEAAGLVLEDFNWREGCLRLQRTKGRRERLLPVPPAGGQAIVHYLQQARPQTAQRRLFVSLPEGQPLSSQAISQLVSQALRQAQVIFPRSGAQLLRRTFATHLVQQGVGVKAIADLLGHRSLNNTSFYAHVNLPQLQTLTQPWPEVAR